MIVSFNSVIVFNVFSIESKSFCVLFEPLLERVLVSEFEDSPIWLRESVLKVIPSFKSIVPR